MTVFERSRNWEANALSLTSALEENVWVSIFDLYMLVEDNILAGVIVMTLIKNVT